MIKNLLNIFKIPDLKRKIIYTILLIGVYRIGSFIPTPGIDGKVLSSYFEQQQKGTLLGFFNLFSGGALKQMSIFALGIMPYVSASIILQLLTVVVPYLEKLSKEGQEGRKKLTQYTRYGTVLLSIVQALGISFWLENLNKTSGVALPIVPYPGLAFKLMVILTLSAGTAFIMWLGERISEHGIGNGISLIIFAGIVAAIPSDIVLTWDALFRTHKLNLLGLLFIGVIIVLSTAAVIMITQGERKIPVQYAKKVVGRKIYGGQSTYIPLKVNSAGVIPIIFASSILMFPATIAGFSHNPILKNIADFFSVNSPYSFCRIFPEHLQDVFLIKILRIFTVYNVLYAVLTVGFTYFYTAVIFNPTELADNMKKYGGFISGVRPGRNTAEFIDRILSRITLSGGIYLALIAILPSALYILVDAPFYFGGTSLLIVVGVALDTMRQIESHLLMRHYEGFIKKGKIKGRF